MRYTATSGYQIEVNVTNADAVIAPADNSRVSVILPTTGADYQIAFGVSTASVAFNVATNQPPFLITRDMIGDLITKDLHFKLASGSGTIAVFIGRNEQEF